MSAEEAAPPVDASASAPPADASPAPPPAAEADAPKSTSSAKKAAGKPRGRPSTGGNKKAAASSANDEKRSFEPGDIVLARLRGYPPWPARIANTDDLPRNVITQRPGKNPYVFCCQFFPAGDYAWLQSREIKPLSPSEITDFLKGDHRKGSGGLKDAYTTAQDPTEWDQKQAEIHRAVEEAENAVDELEDEDEEEPASAGKRKRGAAEKKADKKKKAKTTPKSKAEVDEIQSDDEPKSKSKAKPKSSAKPKAEKAKPTKAAASKPDNQEPVDEDPLASNPECVKVKDWRHKLQRAFLSKSLPTADEMPTYDDLFKTIENYDSITIDALQYSKIGKVMKKIMTLSEIPRNDEFKITDRASKLMHQWTDFIASSESKPNGSASEAKETPTAPVSAAADGEAKEAESDSKPEETKDEAKSDEKETEAEAEPEKKEDGEKMEVDAEA